MANTLHNLCATQTELQAPGQPTMHDTHRRRSLGSALERLRAYDWATYRQLFTPKLVTTLRGGYGLADFRHDATAGLTVAVLALPLSMAIAIGAGVTPDEGLITAVIAGFLISALGASGLRADAAR